MSYLTRREWRVIMTVIGLLALGLMVRAGRGAHSAPTHADSLGRVPAGRAPSAGP